MTEATAGARASAPWHLWVVGVLAVLWNGFGAYDYTMSHLQGRAYYEQMKMTAEQIAFMEGYPTWMHAVWAIGVWGGVLGSLLLLLRSRWAFHVLVASLAAFLLSVVYTYGMTSGGDAMGQQGMIFNVIIAAIGLFLIWYSWTMTKRGVLR
jgi:hypothetical protein